MVSQWRKKAGEGGDSGQFSESPNKLSRRTFEEGSSRSSDPAFVGLCRVLIGLSVLLLLGLAALVGFTVRSDIDWDASVVKVESGDEIPRESGSSAGEANLEGLHFDLSQLNDQGLVGPPEGLRALSYEFCIPAVEAHVMEVEAIDSTIAIQRSSPGRIGCAPRL